MSMSTSVPRTLLLFEAGDEGCFKDASIQSISFLCDGARERQDNRKKTTFAFQVK